MKKKKKPFEQLSLDELKDLNRERLQSIENPGTTTIDKLKTFYGAKKEGPKTSCNEFKELLLG